MRGADARPIEFIPRAQYPFEKEWTRLHGSAAGSDGGPHRVMPGAASFADAQVRVDHDAAAGPCGFGDVSGQFLMCDMAFHGALSMLV